MKAAVVPPDTDHHVTNEDAVQAAEALLMLQNSENERAMSLPKCVQEAIEKGQELFVCLELWRHATAVERDERAVKRDEKKQEMELQRLAMERDVQEKKQTLEREMEEKRLQVKIRELDLQEQAMKTQRKPDDGIREQKHEIKYLLPKYVEGEDIDVFLRSFE